jgi:N-acetylmuramoyl-L-alanine amidase
MFVDHLSYVGRLQKRPLDAVDLAVIHCTELPNLATARDYGEKIHYPESSTGNAGHYYIDREGRVEEWVPPDRVAHHVRGFNERSLGIELDNPGRFPDWYDSRSQAMEIPYTATQLDNLVRLLHVLKKAIPSLTYISGHEMLDRERLPASDRADMQVRRKVDPGPLFPWARVIAATGLEFMDAPGPRLELVGARPPR